MTASGANTHPATDDKQNSRTRSEKNRFHASQNYSIDLGNANITGKVDEKQGT